jgi:CheY-like chemotaxis protein
MTMRVLVIDDDESIRSAIDALLHRETCETVLAANARQGILEVEAQRFDIAMVDIFMPGMNGLEAIKDIRRIAPDLPIVAMSGFRFRGDGPAKPDFLKIAADLGATHCLSKPFGPQQLLAAISACLPKAA